MAPDRQKHSEHKEGGGGGKVRNENAIKWVPEGSTPLCPYLFSPSLTLKANLYTFADTPSLCQKK